MDIENILENSILKHLLTKEMPDEINISFTSKVDNHKYGIVTTVEELAGEIADDIKKSLRDSEIKDKLANHYRQIRKYEEQGHVIIDSKVTANEIINILIGDR